MLLDQKGAAQLKAPLVQRTRRLDSVFIFPREPVSHTHTCTRTHSPLHTLELLAVSPWLVLYPTPVHTPSDAVRGAKA